MVDFIREVETILGWNGDRIFTAFVNTQTKLVSFYYFFWYEKNSYKFRISYMKPIKLVISEFRGFLILYNKLLKYKFIL